MMATQSSDLKQVMDRLQHAQAMRTQAEQQAQAGTRLSPAALRTLSAALAHEAKVVIAFASALEHDVPNPAAADNTI